MTSHRLNTSAPLPAAQAPGGSSLATMFPGLLLAAAVAAVSVWLSKNEWLQAHGISALTLAIVIGMVVGNTVYPQLASSCGTGVNFSKQKLLRLGIILFGLRLTFQDIGQVGLTGVAIDTTVLCSTFALAWVLGTKVFGLDRNTTLLIGAGSSICGAAAVMATEPVVRGEAEQVTIAVSTVVVFGTLGLFLYPALYQLNLDHHWLDLSPGAFGMYAGSTIHEVAQVVAAARSAGEHATGTAVIAKLVRVMMLAPFLLLLSAWIGRSDRAAQGDAAVNQGQQKTKLAIPWFAFGFVVVAGLNSLAVLPAAAVHWTNEIDTVILAMAMAALGLTTHGSAIRRAGIKPLALASTLFIWLLLGGFAINRIWPMLTGVHA